MVAKILALYRENGVLLTVKASWNRLVRRVYNHFLARKLPGADNLSIKPNAVLAGLSHISIGKNFIAGDFLKLEAVTRFQGMTFNPRIVIGDNVSVNDFVHIGATNHVEIGNNVLMASKIFVSDHNHGVYQGEAQTPPTMPPALRPLTGNSRVIIGDNVWIGESVSILAGATIGEGSIIGANSVVAGPIPPRSIAVGAPARVVKTFDPQSGTWLPASSKAASAKG